MFSLCFLFFYVTTANGLFFLCRNGDGLKKSEPLARTTAIDFIIIILPQNTIKIKTQHSKTDYQQPHTSKSVMYFRNLALLAFAALTTVTALTTETTVDLRGLKRDKNNNKKCTKANGILNVDEGIGAFQYTGVAVYEDNDTDPEADDVKGYLSVTAGSGAAVGVQFLPSSIVINAGDITLRLDPSIPLIEINDQPLNFISFLGMLEGAKSGLLTGDMKDIIEGYEAMILWVSKHKDDIPENFVGIARRCSIWTHTRRLAAVTASCVGAGAGWALCVGLPEPLTCIGAIGASVACVDAFENYLECA